MKKVLSFVLILSLLLSMSVVAFAAGSPVVGPGGDSANVAVPAPVKNDEVDIDSIPETAGVSTDNDAAIITAFSALNAKNKALAMKYAAELINKGYKIVSGFAVVGAEDQNAVVEGVKVFVTIPDGCSVFVNGEEVTPTEVDGKLVITVTTPAFVFIVRK